VRIDIESASFFVDRFEGRANQYDCSKVEERETGVLPFFILTCCLDAVTTNAYRYASFVYTSTQHRVQHISDTLQEVRR
jgi:hypothetical protein